MFFVNKFFEPRLFLLSILFVLVAVLIVYFVASMITSVGYQSSSNANEIFIDKEMNSAGKITIIIDAGHGGEDPGAVSFGISEKDLNLSVANHLASYLKISGYNVVMTRTDDRLLYNDGEEDQKKYFDLYNRVLFAESCGDAIFVSVHMNKYPLESCKGLQTFYSEKNVQSISLAESVQESSRLLASDNNRQIKSSQDSIFLLNKLTIPSVLIECGFISNRIEATLLSDQVYQKKLAFVISCGIINFIKEYDQINIS
jgi:N-acetylmuramoyl-L-alanine amidase